ncbi:phosphinothricin acetyltransferase [Bhargavaea ginsengi]|uniref:Phosphinothricin acetyltransferase n=1 Tax=Bhargavaea ginsengi TaxID=426757 RepID=A0A1H6YTW6_9BACL|nr:GNAT family N-acetyltransferase [Bhargavaea ginsengi]MCM3086729.1 N-acetyltransferase family protein [Bhargavaea ginsengi]SEJ43776.1 phosphinothricin acetyltransferase [Bhargavaea ginsengi]
MIRKVRSEDFEDVLEIYREGMATGIATFETRVPSEDGWDRKFHPELRFVYEDGGKILGWVSLTPFSARNAYRGVGEVSVYVKHGAGGSGIGTSLLRHLEEEARRAGYWTLQAAIFEENTASIRLHEKCGFRIVGVREKIAMRDGVWHNNVLMEKRIVE